jgi:hypothetical protein
MMTCSLSPKVVAFDESELVRHLRDQISRLNKDIAGLHAMAALVKKKSKISTAVEQHALDRLRVASESLSYKQSIALFLLILLFCKQSSAD